MKTEYIAEIKRLIQENYQPVDSLFEANDYTERKTLKEVHRMLTNILPAEWVYESDVYNILHELGFKHFLHTFPAIMKDEEEIYPERTGLFYFMDKKTAAV